MAVHSGDTSASPGFELTLSRRTIALAGLLLLGLVVRLWAARWPPFPYDMNTWIAWGERLYAVPPSDFYAEGYFANYTPGYMYVLWLVAAVKHLLFESADTGTYYFLHRIPALICDLAIGVVIFRVVDHAVRRMGVTAAAEGEEWPIFATVVAALWLFNPAVILNSAVWGQVESVFVLPMLLAVVLLLDDKPEWAVPLYALAFLIKPQAIVIAPVLALALLLWFPPRRVLIALALGAVTGIVLLLPFYGLRFIPRFWEQLSTSSKGFEYTSMNLYNLWGIYGLWRDDRVSLFGPISARGFGLGLYVLGLAYGLWLLWQQLRSGADRTFTMFLFCSYFAFLPVMVLTLLRERYLYPVLPFLLIFAALCYLREEQPSPATAEPQRFLLAPLILYVALTVLHTMNLYQVYEYYLNFETTGPPLTNTLYRRIADNVKVWSAFSVFCLWVFAVLIPTWTRADDAGRVPESDARPTPAPALEPA